MAAEPPDTVRAELDRLAGALPALGIAVSGGGDSVALLSVAAAWGRARGIVIEAATVDHALRAGAADEAAAVARACATLGVRHEVLHWDHGGVVPGNLMAAARAARMRLLGGWAGRRGLAAVALGHTRDDQAETVLMRLARGAGVDGLSGMAPARRQDGVLWLRPMLGVGRADLRGWLAAQGLCWAEDPTNDDPAFDRVRIRQAMAALNLPAAQVARSAEWLAEARAALAEAAVDAAAGADADRGMLRLPASVLSRPAETRRRLIAAGLIWVRGGDYPPRGADVARLIAALSAGRQASLGGVLARIRAGRVEMLREPAGAARAEMSFQMDIYGRKTVIWDARWRLSDLPDGAVLRAASVADLSGRDWRASGLPREAILSSPAVGAEGGLLLPLLDAGCGVGLSPVRGLSDYIALLRAH